MNSFQRVTCMLIDTTLDNIIEDIRINKNIAIRKYAYQCLKYLNNYLNDDISTFIKTIIDDDSSPYYQMINNIIIDVNPIFIKKMTINLIYRSYEKKNQVPKTIMMELDDKKIDFLNFDNISLIINDLENQDIHAHQVICNYGIDNLKRLINLFSLYQDSGFVLYIQAFHINDEIADLIESSKNIITMFKIEERKDFELSIKSINLLRKRKCFYGIYYVYNNSNLSFINTSEFYLLTEAIRAPIIILIKKENSNNLLINKVINKYPFVMVDLFNDFINLTKTISQKSPFFIIKSNGDVAINNLSNIIPNFNIKIDHINNLLNRKIT